jgi:hypothetical protein
MQKRVRFQQAEGRRHAEVSTAEWIEQRTEASLGKCRLWKLLEQPPRMAGLLQLQEVCEPVALLLWCPVQVVLLDELGKQRFEAAQPTPSWFKAPAGASTCVGGHISCDG